MKIRIGTLIILFLICSVKPLYAERPINEIPMYGGQHDPKVPENKEFSNGAAELGWKYYNAGDYDTAIKRFNQSWMFDRNNPQAFWGFGAIMGLRATREDPENNLKESIKFLEKANELSKDNPRIMVDLAYSETMMGVFMKRTNKKGFQYHFDKARDLFKKSEALDKSYPLLYSNRSILEFFEENHIKAKEQLDIAKKLGFKPNPEYENDLNKKLKSNK